MSKFATLAVGIVVAAAGVYVFASVHAVLGIFMMIVGVLIAREGLG